MRKWIGLWRILEESLHALYEFETLRRESNGSIQLKSKKAERARERLEKVATVLQSLYPRFRAAAKRRPSLLKLLTFVDPEWEERAREIGLTRVAAAVGAYLSLREVAALHGLMDVEVCRHCYDEVCRWSTGVVRDGERVFVARRPWIVARVVDDCDGAILDERYYVKPGWVLDKKTDKVVLRQPRAYYLSMFERVEEELVYSQWDGELCSSNLKLSLIPPLGVQLDEPDFDVADHFPQDVTAELDDSGAFTTVYLSPNHGEVANP